MKTHAPDRSSLHLVAQLVSVAVLICGGASVVQAQAPVPNDPGLGARAPWVMVYERRVARTERSIEEPARRELERQHDSSAGHGQATTKPGVVRALTPAEQQALAHMDKGLALFAKNKYDKAVAEYLAALHILPTLAIVHNNLGSAYFALNRLDEAMAAYKQAIQLEPTFALAHFNLGLLYLKQGREQDATGALNRAAQAYLAAGDEHLKTGDLEAAEEDFKTLLLIDPAFYPGRIKLGIVYSSANRQAEAVALFQQLIREQPAKPDAYCQLGVALYQLGRYGDAVNALQQAVKLQPDGADAHYQLGKTYLKLGQLDRARAEQATLVALHATERASTLAALLNAKPTAKP